MKFKQKEQMYLSHDFTSSYANDAVIFAAEKSCLVDRNQKVCMLCRILSHRSLVATR